MKLKIKKDILLENLNNVSKALSTKNLIPVLAGIKFDLKDDGLYLTCSDNDITIQAFIEKENIESIEKTGCVVLQGKYILDIVRKIPSEVINIEIIDGFKTLINSTNSSFNLNGIDPSEFPKSNLEFNSNPIILEKKVIKKIVSQTSYATSTQETRPLLTGINFNISGNKVICTATDSYRLAKKIINLDMAVNEEFNIVIPSKNLLELVKILNEDKTDVEIHIFSNKVLFKFDNIIFQSRLLSGTYPDTSSLIPEDFLVKIDVNLTDFYNVIDRASLLTSDKDKNIVQLETNNNIMTVSSSSPEIGKVDETMEIVKNDETDIKIAFSAKYMMEALRALSDDEIEILFNGEIKPIIIKDKQDESIIQLILPIKTY